MTRRLLVSSRSCRLGTTRRRVDGGCPRIVAGGEAGRDHPGRWHPLRTALATRRLSARPHARGRPTWRSRAPGARQPPRRARVAVTSPVLAPQPAKPPRTCDLHPLPWTAQRSPDCTDADSLPSRQFLDCADLLGIERCRIGNSGANMAPFLAPHASNERWDALAHPCKSLTGRDLHECPRGASRRRPAD